MRVALATAALLFIATTPALAAETDRLIWDSDEHAHPTQGRSGTWTPPELFSAREHPGNTIRIKGESPDGREYLMIELTRHDGQRITEGPHEDQKVLVVNRGLGWVDEAGDFDVDHVAYGSDGQISEFDAAIEHHYLDEPDTTFRAKVSYRR
ncbi:hypothetical protein [Lentzea sp.]|uniref:hypothetical protein n=1 Tax=Lentzea sp. TaxID=56099 RepID=UPI002ED363A6